MPCPFLEDESCSIHPERPLVCREYLVTSPAELCAGPKQEGVTPVAVPKVSLAARGLQEEKDDWFPLAMLMAWARTRAAQGDATDRAGMGAAVLEAAERQIKWGGARVGVSTAPATGDRGSWSQNFSVIPSGARDLCVWPLKVPRAEFTVSFAEGASG